MRKAKESSMGIDVEYSGDKSLLTKNLIELDIVLVRNINHNKNVMFPHESIPDLPIEHISISFGKK